MASLMTEQSELYNDIVKFLSNEAWMGRYNPTPDLNTGPIVREIARVLAPWMVQRDNTLRLEINKLRAELEACEDRYLNLLTSAEDLQEFAYQAASVLELRAKGLTHTIVKNAESRLPKNAPEGIPSDLPDKDLPL
jgi:hypothetical protein